MEHRPQRQMNEVGRPLPKPPPQVRHFVEVLGPELTAQFLLAFGGAELYIADDPKGSSRLEALVGYEKAKALGALSHRMTRRVPLAKPWVAAFLAWQGNSTAEIARRLHVSDVSVRTWLARDWGK